MRHMVLTVVALLATANAEETNEYKQLRKRGIFDFGHEYGGKHGHEFERDSQGFGGHRESSKTAAVAKVLPLQYQAKSFSVPVKLSDNMAYPVHISNLYPFQAEYRGSFGHMAPYPDEIQAQIYSQHQLEGEFKRGLGGEGLI